MGEGDVLVGPKDRVQNEDSDMGTEAELTQQPPRSPAGPGPWVTPRWAGCTEFVTVTVFPGLLMSC